MLNVFIHVDGSSSAPFCELGKREIYRWANGDCVGMEGMCCTSIGCTCSNEWPISRKANAEEKQEFYNTLNQMADAAIYESNLNL